MKRNKLIKRIRRDVSYVIIRSAIGFFRLLPRKAALALGSAIGRIIPFVARKEYRLAREHLTIAFGAEKSTGEIRRLARDAFRHTAMNFVDTVRLRSMGPDEVKRVCIPHGMDHLWKALAEGHGVIGLTSHTGCWELLGVYLAVSGVPTSAIGARLYDPRLEKMLLDTRTGSGMRNISRGENTRDVIRVLKEGFLLGILIDQDTKVKGEFVDFFGKPSHTAVGPAQLALKYHAPIVPIFTYRDARHYHHACIGEALSFEPTGNLDRDVIALTSLCSNATETFIAEHPEQWVWFHERWKKTPGEQNNNVPG